MLRAWATTGGCPYNRAAGMTALEMIIALGVLAMVFSIIFLAIDAYGVAWQQNSMRLDVDRRANHAMEQIKKDLRHAEAVRPELGTVVGGFYGRMEMDLQPSGGTVTVYFYNAADAYPPSYGQTRYELRRYSGVIDAGSYGQGAVLTAAALPPGSGVASGFRWVGGGLNSAVEVKLKISDKDEETFLRSEVLPRNR